MMASAAGTITAVVFDKDGTLLDFDLTWNQATADVLTVIANGDPARQVGAAAAIGFDLDSGVVLPGSPLISESNAVIAGLLLPWADPTLGLDAAGLDAISSQAAGKHLTAMAHADTVVRALHERGVRLAIATNDSATAARTTIERLGWTGLFDAAIGYDSGYGAKPDPGMVHGAMAELDTPPADTIMVGDSPHDVIAGNRAGAHTVLLGDPAKSGDWTDDAAPDHVISSLLDLLTLRLL